MVNLYTKTPKKKRSTSKIIGFIFFSFRNWRISRQKSVCMLLFTFPNQVYHTDTISYIIYVYVYMSNFKTTNYQQSMSCDFHTIKSAQSKGSCVIFKAYKQFKYFNGVILNIVCLRQPLLYLLL